MTRHFFPLIVAVLFSAAALVAVTHPVAAAPPIIQDVDFEIDFLYDCGSVVLSEHATVHVRVEIFVDAAGNPVRELDHFNFVGVITNPATGQTFRDVSHVTLQFDEDTGELTNVGNLINLMLPGEGTVLRGVGRRTIDANGNVLFEAGVHEAVGLGTDLADAICAALVG